MPKAAKRKRGGITRQWAASAAALTGLAVKAARKRRRISTESSSRSSSRSPVLSQTRTRTQRRRQTSRGNQQLASGPEVTFTKYKLKGRVTKKKLAFVSAKNTLRISYAQRTTVTSGIQSVDVLGTDGSGASPTTVGLFNVNEIEKVRALLLTSVAGGSLTAYQFAIPVAKATYYISNSTNANTIMWIYDLVPRNNVYSTDTSYDNPIQAWYTGLQTQPGNHSGALTTGGTLPFSTPFESKTFCEQYHVIKVRKLILAPGVMHIHKVFAMERRWFSDSQYMNLINLGTGALTSTCYYVGKKTILSMVVILGSPAHSLANADSAHTSTAPAAIDIVTHKEYTYLYSQTGQKNVSWTNTIPTGIADLREIPEAQEAFVLPVLT
jgi:hypothetical protein